MALTLTARVGWCDRARVAGGEGEEGGAQRLTLLSLLLLLR